MRFPHASIRLSSLLLLALSACAADVSSSTERCAPLVAGDGAYECPAGCTELTGDAYDPERTCTTGGATVIGCHPDDVVLTRSGNLSCFERDGGHAVLSGSVAQWTTADGTVVDLIEQGDWRACTDWEMYTRCDP